MTALALIDLLRLRSPVSRASARTSGKARGRAAARLAPLLLACATLAASAQDQPATPPPAPAARQEDAAIPPERLAAEAEIKQLMAEVKALFTDGKLAEAEAAARRANARAEELLGAKDGYVGVTSANLGRLLRYTGRPAEAAPLMLRALEIASLYFSIGDKPYKDAVGELAETLIAARRAESAAPLYERIVAAASQDPARTLDEAYYRSELGLLLRRIGRFPAAEAELRKALELRERHLPPDHADIGRTLTDLAGLMRVTGRFAEAETLYLRTIELRRRTGDSTSANVGILLDNLGVVYNELGRYADAERVQRQALAIFEGKLGREHLTTALGAANLAALYYVQGRHQEALMLFERARDVYRRTLKPDDPRIGILLDNLGGLYRDLGRKEEARATMREALTNLTATYPDTHPEVAVALANLAGGESDLGNDHEAEALYRRALNAYTASLGEQSHQMAAVLTGLAEIQMRKGQIAEAQEGYRRAVAIVEKTLGPEHPSLVRPLRLLAGQALGLRQFAEAMGFSRRALQVEIASRGRRRLDQGERAGSDDGIGPFLGALDVAWHVRAAGLATEWSLDAEAFETAQWVTLSSAGRSLAQLGVRLSASNAELSGLVRERQDLARDWSATDARLVRSVGQPADRRDPAAEDYLRTRLTSIETRLAEIDRRLRDDFSAFSSLSQPRPLALAEARALLKPDEALLQFVTASTHTYVWAITPDRVTWHRIELSEAEITKRVETLRCGFDAANWIGDAALTCFKRTGRAPEGDLLPFDGATAHALYRDLVAPVAHGLEGRTLLIVATGALTSLPFQVLLTAPAPTLATSDFAAAPWLLRSNAVATLPAIASLATLRRQAGTSRARRPYLGIANPLLVGPSGSDLRSADRLSCPAPGLAAPALAVAAAMSPAPLQTLIRGGRLDASQIRSLTPLPETTDEICSVGRGLGASLEQDLLIGSAATEAHLKSSSVDSRLADYRIIHFATHGLISGELAGLIEPALVMTPPETAVGDDEGLLTASEIASLRLDADVVVLSACNTAAGEGQGGQALSGLARAFFFAGARSLIVSHWPVNSEAAVKLIAGTFETAATSPGIGKAEALRLAMAGMLTDAQRPHFAHPQMWAPFVLVGEPQGGAGVAAISTGSVPAAGTPAPSPTLGAAPATRARAATTRGHAANRRGAKPKGGTSQPADEPHVIFRDQGRAP